ncbi:MAG: hypothetical protein K2H63_01025 [Paramuribaculum sp.]|nr:hypothetical protein [Paramuribaculum sp.]
MMVDFCKKLSHDNFIPNKPERINQVWDQRILHVAGQSIGEQAIILVTNDKAMLDAAKNSVAPITSATLDSRKYNLGPTTVSNNVMSYSDYCLWLEYRN